MTEESQRAQRPIRVVMVEDEPTILAQQRRLLAAYTEQIEIVGTARDGKSALAAIERHTPDVVLLDLGLPDIDGIEVTRRVKARWPEIDLLIFTIFDDEARVLEAVQAGASGYLLKGVPAERMVEALVDVGAGGSVIQPKLARSLLRRLQAAPQDAQTRLTARETEILNLIAKGMSNRQAAETLGISRATVRTHLEHIYGKLEVSSRTEAVTEAIRQGIIEP
jgi:DNA-binding NarL/FixJ family response regulator